MFRGQIKWLKPKWTRSVPRKSRNEYVQGPDIKVWSQNEHVQGPDKMVEARMNTLEVKNARKNTVRGLQKRLKPEWTPSVIKGNGRSQNEHVQWTWSGGLKMLKARWAQKVTKKVRMNAFSGQISVSCRMNNEWDKIVFEGKICTLRGLIKRSKLEWTRSGALRRR